MDWEARGAATFLLCLVILLTTIPDGTAEQRVVCYYTNWSVYRPGTAKFSPQNINPYLCTHLIYAFGGFTKDNALKPFDKYQDIEKGGYAKFNGLKTYNKNLKTMLAIGGWNEGSSRFSPMVADPGRRRQFVKNSIKFLRQNHFDGLDLDWEYPAFRDGGKPRDRDNYASLVQELREEFERESSKTGRPRLLLSMAMPAGANYIDKGYDVPKLNDYLDFINLLSYDYHSAYEPAVNHHSPLYPLEEDNEYSYDNELTIDYTINYLLEKGASAEKIVLGIPTYGRSYTLFNEDATELGSPADGPGEEGDATREKGYLAYYEICETLSDSEDWEVIQPNPKAMGPYAFKGNQWVGYDDEGIVRKKAKYVNEKNLGGIMFWSIDNDDFRGKCHGRAYPLIEAAKEALLSTSSTEKSKSADSRKKIRPTGLHSNAIARKFTGGRRTTTTTSAPINRKRSSTPRPKFRTLSRGRSSSEEEDDEEEVDRRSYQPDLEDEEEDNTGGNAVRSVDKSERSKSKSKGRSRLRGSGDRNRRKQSRRKENEASNHREEEHLSNKLTTPEPPTTPDPGTDFKCEDEGFFSHPRDCKKYFWCLDSGPGGLGVVAHQFTCPSGLVFNKAADSCDYPRNVVCPKAKSVASTTRAPITAATSRTTYLHTSTRKTTTEKAESEEEYEYYDEEEEEEEEEVVVEKPKFSTTSKPLLYKTINRSKPTTTTTTTTTTTPAPSTTLKIDHSDQDKDSDSEDEEDPRVIKELIDLIKKAGGIEQLEKQLLLQDKSSDAPVSSQQVTPATISRTLYERVLSRQASKIGGNQRKPSSQSYGNGPGGSQFEGLEDLPEVKTLRRSHKPQYVTIERQKTSTKEPPVDEDEEDEEDDDVDDGDNTDVASSEERTVSNRFLSSSTQRATPNYVNIRRNRPSTTTARNENDVEEREDEVEDERPFRRRRPTTPKTSDKDEAGDQVSHTYETVEETPTTKSRYVNILRFRSTTSKPVEEVLEQVESTTESPTPETTETTVPTKSTSTEVSESSTITVLPSTLSSVTSSISTEITKAIVSIKTSEITPVTEVTVIQNTTTPTSTSTEPVKLVEDSATEILLTTSAVQGTAKPTSSPITRNQSTTVATIAQPRPFGFPRRNRPSVASTEATSTPIAPSKVSISRNSPRTSALPTRSRFKSRQESAKNRPPEGDVAEAPGGGAPPTEEVLSKPRESVGRSRYRGTSRYTPPSYASKRQEPSANSIRERARTETSTTSTEAPKRKFRRPQGARTASTEAPKPNELNDSPIVRINQGYNRRSNFRSRYAAPKEAKSEEKVEEKITTIKVFKRPVAVNRDVYARTRYTKKKNNVEIEEHTEEPNTLVDKQTSPFLYATASTVSLVNLLLDSTTTEESVVNTVDHFDDTTPIDATTENLESTDVEANTVEAETTIVTQTPITEPDDEGKTNDYPTTTESQTQRNDEMKVVLDASNDESSMKPETNSTVHRRRKVLLRRRPLVPSVSPDSVRIEEESPEIHQEKKPLVRRRKVIKRIRPVNGSTTSSSESPRTTEEQNINTHFTMPSTTPNHYEQTTETPLDEVTKMYDVTEVLSTTEYTTPEVAKVTLEIPSDTTIINEEVYDTTTISSIQESSNNDSTEKENISMDTSTVDPLSDTTIASSTETNDIVAETEIITPEPDYLLSTTTTTQQPTIADIMDHSTPQNIPETSSSKPETSDARYVRKKFIRRRPVSPENGSGRLASVSRNVYRVSSTTEGGNLEAISKRRKTLFIRRRPVSSTTTRTTQAIENDSYTYDDTVDNDYPMESEQENNTDTPVDPTPVKVDSHEFWKHYTTISLPNVPEKSPVDQIESESTEKSLEATQAVEETVIPSSTDVPYQSTPSNRRLELRPRYRVPDSLRKTASIEETSKSTLNLYSPVIETEDATETVSRTRSPSFRRARTRYRFRDDVEDSEESEDLEEPTQSTLDSSAQVIRTRFFARKPITSTEVAVTETLIPARKFDYAADAVHRRAQSLKSNARQTEDEGVSTSRDELQNLVDSDYTTKPAVKPLVTRLVTSVEESATTERQKILIKTKYSSLTASTRISAQNNRWENSPTTLSPISETLVRTTSPGEDESLNEIRQGVERSTLPIESEFLHRGGRAFTTESHESSTIEIESVFSNLIAGREPSK